MSVTAIEGIVKNGQIQLLTDISLPENTKVYIVVPEPPRKVAHIYSPRLVNPEDAGNFVKEVVEAPYDASL